ncbi:MAG: hypothetical protein QM504_03230 [Pseudomonadota bacterium]
MKSAVLLSVVISSFACAGDMVFTGSEGKEVILPIEYPSNYLVGTCELAMTLVTDTVNFSTIDASLSWNASDGSCPGRAHYFQLDGLYYPYNNDIYLDFSGFSNLLWIKQDFFNCHTANGALVNDDPPNFLLGNFFLGQLDSTKIVNQYYPLTNIMVTSFNSTNHNIICNGSFDISSLLITMGIFADGFE